MSSTPEGKVKSDIKRVLNSLPDCWHFSPMMIGYGRKGIPDIIGCYRGMFFAIEVKAPGKIDNTTPWQERELAAIHAAGGVDLVLDSAIGVKEILMAHYAVLGEA
jgi:hypothetical protein